MHKSWSHLTIKLWNCLPTRVRACLDFQHIAIIYGTALTLRDRYISGVAGLDAFPLSGGMLFHNILMNLSAYKLDIITILHKLDNI